MVEFGDPAEGSHFPWRSEELHKVVVVIRIPVGRESERHTLGLESHGMRALETGLTELEVRLDSFNSRSVREEDPLRAALVARMQEVPHAVHRDPRDEITSFSRQIENGPPIRPRGGRVQDGV
jgi:hypothetical protein